MYVSAIMVLYLTMKALSETITLILFYANKDNLSAYQVLLVYPVPKFDKAYLH